MRRLRLRTGSNLGMERRRRKGGMVMPIKHFGALLAVGSLVFTFVACSPAARQRAVTIASGAAAGAAGASPSQYSAKLMIFGGMDHKTYLGCLSCNEYASDSLFNSYGNNGS